MERVNIDKIRLNPKAQPRLVLDMFVVDEYAQNMRDGAVFPPVVLFSDEEDYWAADGFHRINAARSIGKTVIDADVRPGGLREAILFSVGTNADHGLKRTNKDKENAVKKLLDDEEWRQWSDREIARRCRVSEHTVARQREILTAQMRSDERKYTTKHGTVATMKTENIGERIAPEVREAIRESGVLDDQQDLFSFTKLAPEVQEKVAEKIASGEATTVTDAKRQVKQEQIQNAPVPVGKHRVLYADPPWQYGNTGLDQYGPAERHYSTISTNDLCGPEWAGPIKELADKNAVLFLWVTSPLLPDGLQVLKAWGFEYKASFVWDKVKHNFGHYNSVRHELLLICTRGSCLPECKELHDSVVELERSSVHSEKPAYFRELIDKMYPSGSRIELFARGSGAPGWEVWGNEAMSVSSITALSRNLATSAPMSV